MTSSNFEHFIVMVGPKIVKQDTNYRQANPMQEKPSVTLRFLVPGNRPFSKCHYLFSVDSIAAFTDIYTKIEVKTFAFTNY